MKIYGPYTRKDGRQHVILIHPDGRKQTKSYPRYLLEQEIGRELTKSEEVDHIDNNPTNNSLKNLQILTKKENRIKEMVRPHRAAKKKKLLLDVQIAIQNLNYLILGIKETK